MSTVEELAAIVEACNGQWSDLAGEADVVSADLATQHDALAQTLDGSGHPEAAAALAAVHGAFEAAETAAAHLHCVTEANNAYLERIGFGGATSA